MHNVKNLIFCGFMGAGKSTLLKKFKDGDHRGYIFIDLDELIIPNPLEFSQIISQKGMNWFREEERKKLNHELSSPDLKAIALGGGTLNEDTIKKVKNGKDILIWIDTPFEVCFERIKNTQNIRPLTSLSKEELLKLYNQRKTYYEMSDICLNMEQQLEIKNLNDLFEKFIEGPFSKSLL